MTKNDPQRVLHLKEENRRLKKLVMDLAVDNSILKEVPRQKVVNPDQSLRSQMPVKSRGIRQVRYLFGLNER